MSKVLVAAALIGAASLNTAQDVASDHDADRAPDQGGVLRDGVAMIPHAPRTIQQDDRECRDRLIEAREATGQEPLLERGPASPDKPYAIYAVHREQGGCAVMVMMGNPDDVRPLPAPMEEPFRVLPAAAGQ